MGLAAELFSELPEARSVPPALVVLDGGRHSHHTKIRRDALVLGIVLVVLQIADFALTAVGVFHFGLVAEGNPLIRELMHMMGSLPALLLVKGFAVGIIFTLIHLAPRVTWVPHAMRLVIVFYTCAAIVPWSGLLIIHLI